jgi:hypothetical protein
MLTYVISLPENQEIRQKERNTKDTVCNVKFGSIFKLAWPKAATYPSPVAKWVCFYTDLSFQYEHCTGL